MAVTSSSATITDHTAHTIFMLLFKSRNMKKVFFGAFLTLCGCMASAQGLRLNGYGSYVFDDSYNSTYDTYNYYHGKIQAGGQYGAGLEYTVHNQYGVELMYLHQTTHAPTNYQEGNNFTPKDVNFGVNLD